MKNAMVILVGPSGAGKSTLLDRAIQDFPELRDTVTYTTRSMRAGEQEGAPYHFVTRETFLKLIDEDFFVEWAAVHDQLYGTPGSQIQGFWDEGKTVIMDVDPQGAKTFKAKYPQALTVFILPPSIDKLRQRLASRDAGKTKDLELRMANAQKEILQAEDFDHQLVNDDLEGAYESLKKLIEELLRSR